MTCSGGSNPGDTRVTNNGLDPLLSTAVTGQPPRVGAIPPPETVRPGSTALGSPIPSDFPPSFLLSGTRDMCLSQTVLLHRKLRRAGVPAELNVFEGMWHAFHGDPQLPESHEALRAFAAFLAERLG
jgi:acetyl esterase/lipase